MSIERSIWTIGHSNRTLDQFISLLIKNDIRCLVDVRSGLGQSIHNPQFNKDTLLIECVRNGIGYIHIPDLGGRRGKQSTDKGQNKGWRVRAFENYSNYCYTKQFQDSLKGLIEISSYWRTCYMCSEAVPWRCHRSIISDYLQVVYGFKVYNIISQYEPKLNVKHQHCKQVGDVLTFPH